MLTLERSSLPNPNDAPRRIESAMASLKAPSSVDEVRLIERHLAGVSGRRAHPQPVTAVRAQNQGNKDEVYKDDNENTKSCTEHYRARPAARPRSSFRWKQQGARPHAPCTQIRPEFHKSFHCRKLRCAFGEPPLESEPLQSWEKTRLHQRGSSEARGGDSEDWSWRHPGHR